MLTAALARSPRSGYNSLRRFYTPDHRFLRAHTDVRLLSTAARRAEAYMHTVDGNAKLCPTCHGGRKIYEYIGLPDNDADDLLRRLGMPVDPVARIVQEVRKPCPRCKGHGVVVRRGND